MKKWTFVLLICLSQQVFAQVTGGEHVFEFLRLSQSPHISSLGGIALANPSSDVMMSFTNPALLRPEFHTQIGLNYNFYYAGTRVSNFYYAQHLPKLNTTFGLGIQYLNYGKFNFTDALGNSYGTGSASDYAISLSASRSYLTRWRYGATIKYAHSNLFDKKSSAVLADIGVVYADTNAKWYLAAAVKNAGAQLSYFDPQTGAQPLPLDLQIGLTKKFKKAPFTIMVLAHHLYTWDIRYDNPADQQDNTLLFTDTTQNTKKKSYFADKLFRHFVFALDVNLGKRLEISAGYNHLRRSELAIDERKGLSGFSFGAGLYLNQFTIHYAQSYYHIAGPYNEVGINVRLNDLFGLGDAGKRINWSEKFAKSYL
ncbi:MAG: type IX secretion system protein PorQ [Chitinophagaceae bacterium]|nr:type IX secretion system protein PorQ [Chitinophagaceae bacterium]